METVTIDEWLESLQESAKEFASRSLRFDGGMAPEPATTAGLRPGAYIALLGESCSMHLGISTTPEGCRTLARAFLGMRQKQEISERDVVDGMSEVLNILAGKVKSRLSARDASLRLGIPVFIHGPIRTAEGTETASAEVSLGPVACRLLVYRSARNG